MKLFPIVLLIFWINILIGSNEVIAQEKDIGSDTINQTEKKGKVSKFDKFNKKAEHIFKIIPVPIYSYSTETGHLFGLAKYNLFHLSKKDTISIASKVTGIVTFSTLGNISVGGGTTLFFGQGKYMFETNVGYKQFPEYILGIGNDVSRDDVEEIEVKNLAMFFNIYQTVLENFQVGIEYHFSEYFSIEKQDNSFLTDTVTGYDGGMLSGFGPSVIYDSRDNRYNASKGGFAQVSFVLYNYSFGSDFNYGDLFIDLRKYFNPYLKHVYAFQLFTSIKTGQVPFYSLNMMGGTDRMRGYYYGAIRDKSIIDAQFEYRMPVWKIFGVTAFVGAGRVAPEFNELNFNDLWYSYGFGLRIMVDSENKANLRIDFGYGQEKAKGIFIGFTEAF